MERLSAEMLTAALRFVEAVTAAPDLDGFRACVMREMPAVVPAHVVTYNEIDIPRGTVYALANRPLEVPVEVFARWMHQHPVLAVHAAGPEERVLAISDLMSAEDFEALELYRHCYGPLGVRDQLVLQFSAPGDFSLSVVVCRSERGFTEAEHRVLELLRPHLANAYDAARSRSLNDHLRALLGQMAAADSGVAVLGTSGRVVEADAEGARLLATLGWRPEDGGLAPRPLARWAARHQGDRGPARLRLGDVLLEGAFDVPAEGEVLLVLRGLGGSAREALTAREHEVLELVAEGLSDAQIAGRLGIAAGTVRKHLEHARAKLGVPTRAAAVARALRDPGAG